MMLYIHNLHIMTHNTKTNCHHPTICTMLKVDQLSNEKKGPWYIGDYTTQLYGDYHKP